MKRLIMMFAGLVAGIATSEASANCLEGSVSNCTTTHGCPGTRECDGSGWGLCESLTSLSCTLANGCPGTRECAGAPCKPVQGTKSCTVCGGPGTQQCSSCGIPGVCTRSEQCNDCDDDNDGIVDEGLPYCNCPDVGLDVPCHPLPIPVLPAFVGVIPESSCPCGTKTVTIHMDDENTLNANFHLGWIGAMSSNNDTTFKFCRVDGSNFKPLSTVVDQSNNYAVLKLDSSCPANSQEFSRTFDNENIANDNSFLGPLFPNSSTKSPSATKLHFCLFRSAPAGETMGIFPDIGENRHYGVFAAAGFARTLPQGAGLVRTDDEDNLNMNSFGAPASIFADAQKIVSGGPDTKLRVAKVR